MSIPRDFSRSAGKNTGEGHEFQYLHADRVRSISLFDLAGLQRNGAAYDSAAPFPVNARDLVPVAVEVRPGVAPVAPVEVPVKMARPEHRVGMAHADRLEAVPEATSLGRLHERYTGDRGGHNRPKNKPHEVTSLRLYLPKQHRGIDKKSHPIR